MKKINIENQPRKTPFTTPEGYFEDLPMRMQKRIQQEQPKVWQMSWGLVGKMALAPLALLLVIWWGYSSWESPTNQMIATKGQHEQIIQEVGYEAILEYLSEEDGLPQEELYDLAGELYSNSEENSLENLFLEEVDLYELDEYL